MSKIIEVIKNEAATFFLEVCGIILLGASYSMYLQRPNFGKMVAVMGIIVFALSKWKPKKKNDRNN